MTDAIDLDFRPASYFRPQALEGYVLSRVKGALVKAHLRELLASDRHDEVARLLREEGVPEDEVRALGSIHPLFMGGNYLPNSRPGEVEIARIFIRIDHRGCHRRLRPSARGAHPLPGGGRVQRRHAEKEQGSVPSPTAR
jgi:hypothetical protein